MHVVHYILSEMKNVNLDRGHVPSHLLVGYVVLIALCFIYMHTCPKHLCMANWFMFTLNPRTHQLYVDILEYHFQVIDSCVLKACILKSYIALI